MRNLVIYESMFGNTHTVADAIARGLGGDTTVVRVTDVTPDVISGIDLVVCGAPTHIHGLPSHMSREAAVKQQAEHHEPVDVDAGVREWLAHLDGPVAPAAAAFDTRLHGAPLFTGRAARRIGRRLRRKGFRLVVAPESFLVDKHNELIDGEADRAEAWGRQLAAATVAPVPS